MTSKTIFINLLVYGLGHFLIDAICIGILFSINNNQALSDSYILNLIILYNFLAFGLQAPLGLLSDIIQKPKIVVLAAIFLISLSAIFYATNPGIAVIISGIGNALFHVGAGSIVLNLTPQKATAPGIFVAPGAFGVLVGILFGKNGHLTAFIALTCLIALTVAVLALKQPLIKYEKIKVDKNKFKYLQIAVLLIFISIAIRSLVGSVIDLPWKTNLNLLIFLTSGVVLGKALGGILADKFGWTRIGVGALALSTVFLTLWADQPLLAIIGMFLFNITMPITLAAISNLLPGKPGFAFGITCLALIMGALLSFTNLKLILGQDWFILGTIIISITSLFFGIRYYYKVITNIKEGQYV